MRGATGGAQIAAPTHLFRAAGAAPPIADPLDWRATALALWLALAAGVVPSLWRWVTQD